MENVTMSDGANSTMYDDYYMEDGGIYAPCNNGNVMEIGTVFLPTLYSLVFILGFIGNGLVLCVLVKHRNQTNLTDMCLFNLALADLLFVLSLPFYSHYAAAAAWIFGDFACRLLSGLHVLGFFGSILFMVAMTLDRYAVIVHARAVARHRTLRTGVAVAACVWTLSACVSLPTLVFTQVRNGSSAISCGFYPDSGIWEEFDLFATNILGLVIPLLVMVLCYSRIMPTLVNMRSAKKHRVVKLIVVIVAIFFFFWTPYNITLLLSFLKSRNVMDVDCHVEASVNLSIQVTEAIAYSHCCLNPILYAFLGQKFMRRVTRMLKNWVPTRCFPRLPREMSESSYRKSYFTSRSSDITSTHIL
ncbi:C-C chemokine receptor type 2-like [Centroberyx affinis]|uniref:C-C chemokine receptor type 2-like n=1 Tax=Centroberyx affinis TaxID=166261 RepID=UPI003A5BD5A8